MKSNQPYFRLILFSFVFLILSSLPAQNKLETDRQIMFYIFNGQGSTADSLIDLQISEQPENLNNYFFKCQNSFYSRYFNPGGLSPDSLMTRVCESAKKAIEIGMQSEMTLDNQFYLGSAYGYLARYHGRRGEYWDAFWAARSARSYLDEVLEENSDYADARQELAVQSYFTSRFTGFFSFLAWLVGMSGDNTASLEQFRIVAEKGKLCKAEAKFVLFSLYLFLENDTLQAMKIGHDFLINFPDNPFLQTQIRQAEFFAFIDDQGIDFFESEFDSLGSKYGITDPAILNNFGYTLMGRNRHDEGIKVFQTNIRLFPHIANGYDSLSEAFLLMNNVEMAIRYSQLCLEKIPFDPTINEEAKENLRQISEERIKMLGADSGKVNI